VMSVSQIFFLLQNVLLTISFDIKKIEQHQTLYSTYFCHGQLERTYSRIFEFLKMTCWFRWFHSQFFVNNFNRIKSLNWLEKTSSKIHSNSIIALKKRRKISKHFMSNFQRISNLFFMEMIFKFNKTILF
jgi:hypothetical protein